MAEIDTSIYGNVGKPQPIANPIETAGNLYKLSDLAMTTQARKQDFTDKKDIRDAITGSVDPATGQPNFSGALSTLAKKNPMAGIQFGQQVASMDAQKAELAQKQLETQVNKMGITYNILASAHDQNSWDVAKQTVGQLGLPTNHLLEVYDPKEHEKFVSQAKNMYVDAKDRLTAQNQQFEQNYKMAMLPTELATKQAELNASLYGSRSPNAELTSQYDKQVAPIRSSQMAMQQMLDNYNNRTPQGDASLVLNAFKIKFPNAPDVNSLAELAHSQAATDQMKNWASEKMQGLKDPETRDNLLRDGISTFRANTDTLAGIQKKFQSRQKVQNVNDPTLTAEPAIEATLKQALAHQEKIGPYIPPGEREGTVIGGLNRRFGGAMGGEQEANAAAGKNKFTAEDLSMFKMAKDRAKANPKDPVAQQALAHFGQMGLK